MVCTKNKCNNDIYPPDRLQCYACNGGHDCDFMPTNSPKPLAGSERKLKPCNTFSVYDQCYAFFTKSTLEVQAIFSKVLHSNAILIFSMLLFSSIDEHVYRGCLSDSSDQRLLCDKEQKQNHSCITCEKSGCNDTPKIRPSTLSCIKCEKSPDCAFGFEKDSAAKCKADVRLGLEESCYIYYRSGMKNHKIQFHMIVCAMCVSVDGNRTFHFRQ